MNVHMLSGRRMRSLEETDGMPADLRACVHEYGYAIVHACVEAKVTDPRRIRQLVREIWSGARQPAQRIGTGTPHRNALEYLDWVLIQAGAEISAATLIRVLRDNHLVVVPDEPTFQMIEASKATVSNHNMKVTKSDKHRLRLKAAIKAAIQQFWPHLDKVA